MSQSRVKAILTVLARGREERLGQTILRIFGASSFEEAAATYDLLGKAERASIDEAVEGMVANASAAFQLSVDNEARR